MFQQVKIILVVLSCIISQGTIAQDAAPRDSVYYELFKQNRVNDLPVATKYAHKSLEESVKYGHYEISVKACYALGYCYRTIGSLDSSIMYYRYGIQIAEKHKINDRLVFLSNDIATVYEKMDMYDSAMYFYTKGKNIAYAIGDKNSEAISLNNIGLINFRINNLSESINNLSASIELGESIPGFDENRIALARTNLALALMKSGRKVEAKAAYNQILKACNNCGSLAEAEATFGLGVIEEDLENYRDALDQFMSANLLFTELGDKVMMSNALYKAASIYMKLDELENVKYYLTKADQIATESKAKRVLRDIYYLWSDYYESTGELEQSLAYKDKFISVKDSIFNEGMSQNIREIMLTDQRKKSDAVLIEKSRALERSYLLTVMMSIIAALLVLLFLTFYRFYTIQKISARKLDKEVKRQTEIVKRSYQDYDHLIYHTSHDVRGPIATIQGLIGLAKLEKDLNPTLQDYLAKMESTSSGLSNMLSKLVLISTIQNNNPKSENVNIRSLVKEIFNSFNYLDHSPLIARTFRSNTDDIINTDINMVNFILRTLIENAFRYYDPEAKDKFISVTLKANASFYTFAIEDNGFGIGDDYQGRIFQLFIVGNANSGDGLGLFLAKRACERLGGELNLTQTRNPTTFTFHIPRNIQAPQVDEENSIWASGQNS